MERCIFRWSRLDQTDLEGARDLREVSEVLSTSERGTIDELRYLRARLELTCDMFTLYGRGSDEDTMTDRYQEVPSVGIK